jgi:hypothetical protein
VLENVSERLSHSPRPSTLLSSFCCLRHLHFVPSFPPLNTSTPPSSTEQPKSRTRPSEYSNPAFYTMPRQELPPTPASSTEIKGKDGGQFSTLQMSFELPPPAVIGTESSSSGASTNASSASSYHPNSPKSPAIPASEVVKIRRRPSMAQPPSKDVFALPPPPTRSRKIIQMKPQAQEAQTMETLDASKTAPGKVNATPIPKKKQPSSTSVAGRKIARKTAHSLIERRRRSKMNEEFRVLKDMIPACTGEMHKLAILQVSDLRHHTPLQALTLLAGLHRLHSISRRLCCKVEGGKQLQQFYTDV